MPWLPVHASPQRADPMNDKIDSQILDVNIFLEIFDKHISTMAHVG